MTDSAPAERASGDASAADVARAEVAERWAGELLAGSRAPVDGSAVRARLAHHLCLLTDPATPPQDAVRDAAEVGRWLVSAGFAGSAVLGRAVEVLGTALVDLPAERVAALLGAVAEGFAEAVERRLVAEQEEVWEGLEDVRDELEAVREELDGTRRELNDSQARFRRLFSSSALGVAIFDPAVAVVEANSALVRMLGRGEEAAENPGLAPEELFEPADLAALRAAWTAMPGDSTRFEHCFTGPQGDPLWTNVTLTLVRDSSGEPRSRVAVVEDMTEQRVLRDYLRHQALHDVLTGLPNRQSFLPRLERALNRPGSVTLCYLDVDSVAIVNDGLGYEAGDELLRVVAQRLTAVVEGEDATVARIGGDEFVVLIEDSPGTPSISALAEAIDAELSEPVYLAGHGVGVSAGMGFVRTSAKGADAMSLLRQAHSTLRRAESGGKGQWGIYDAGQDARDRTRLSLMATMPGALENGEIAIDYRPVERVGGPAAGERAAVAARLRWDETEFGVVGHEDCLAFADVLGLSGQLSHWLLDEACSFAALERLPVLVRLSVDQSRDPDLAAVVAEALRASGLAPSALWLSLAAGSLPDGLDVVEDNLTTLADMGVRRLLHGFTCALPELSLVQRHGLHGVESDVPPEEPLAREALALVAPLLRAAGVLVVGAAPGADLAVRW